ncbi:MAG: T9SS type A sorting domain-containing protein [candidate division WOR-3 bacterium]
MYPNPAKTVIRVRVPGNYSKPDAQSSMLKIFDVSGKLIREIKIPKLTLNSFQGKVQYDRSQEIKISLKGIKPGIYFLRLGAETKKFLVIK